MQFSFALLALAASAQAISTPRAACSFTVNTNRGPLGQLSDGQIRTGLGGSASTFTINNGQITDASGRSCILTTANQFQCDAGKAPGSGFAISSNGQITYNGSPNFFACPATNTAYNIYTVPVPNQNKCVPITLTASGCFTPAPPATTSRAAAPTTITVTRTIQPTCPALQTVTVTVVRTPTPTPIPTIRTTFVVVPLTATPRTTGPSVPASSGKTCPAALTGPYQFPHLIIPVDSSKPNTAAGTSYNGQISSTVSSIFNFDIPASYTGTCSLVFLFPQQKDLQTSSYTFSGPGTIAFSQLGSVATQQTTFANQPAASANLGTFTTTPGTSRVISTFPCPAGKAVSYSLKSVGGTSLTYFQDYNPSPIGLYITTC